MTRERMTIVAAWLLPAAIWLGGVMAAATASADGGAVILSEHVGAYQVTLLASPPMLHVGPADLSVLVQDAGGQPVEGLAVTLCLTPEGGSSDDTLRLAATHAAATNKLFYAAQVDLPTVGRWEVAVKLADAVATQGLLDVAGPPPRWLELWPWFAWPAIIVLLFLLREQVAGQRDLRAQRRAIAASGRA